MAFNDDTQAIEQPQKIHAVVFDVRGVITRYTSSRTAITIAGSVFNPARLEVDISKITNKTVKRTIEIGVSLNDITLQFAANAVPANIKVTVYEVYVETLNCRTIFGGKITRVTLTSPSTAKIVCEGGTSALRDEFPEFSFSSDCNNDLFDPNCGLQESDYETEITVATISGNTITGLQFAAPVFPLARTPDAGQLAEWWTSGFIMLNDETDIRMITSYDGGTSIEIQHPFDSRVVAGSTLKAFPGCKKDAPTCVDKFNNLDGFFGFPYVPNTNPVLFSFDKG